MPYIKKGLELYHNFGNYYVSSYLESRMTLDVFNQFISIKVLLMFSQKRQLEVWFSSLRYIYFNSLGTHTDVLALVKEMPIIEKDSLIYLFQKSFYNNYKRIFEAIQKKELYDILWQKTTTNFDLMVERFEESLFMSKAPFSPHTEHIKNIKSVLDTHTYFMDYVNSHEPDIILNKTDKHDKDDYFQVLEECDFNFDSKMCFIMGQFGGKYISNMKNQYEMQETYNNILMRSYTEISTSKGLRSDKGQFWGQKGHDVIFSKFNYNLNVLLKDFPNTKREFERFIKDKEVTFADKIINLDSDQLLFDMKDKEQYKGSREIYVMSEFTKTLQNPLEKMFSKLCSLLPNELIHKPSGQRPKYIHNKMFEHGGHTGKIMYCTMDCRKWAPRSNLWKYYFMMKGMKDYLPSNFYEHFMFFWSLMFKKKIRFQGSYIDKLKLNEGYKDFNDLKKNGEDYDLIMPYSFMMGIFNFLSSFLHAISQIYFTEKIAQPLNVSCNFVAHSDDSAGIIVAKNYNECLKVYKLYEKFQRTLNHLMSKKKCSLSERAFEIISIMYCDKEFIPLTHKFITNVAIDVKGAGWYDDVSSITSKVVDLYNNGGSYLQCYSIMLSSGELLRKAYHLPRTPLLSHVPLPLGGVMNFHPAHLILIGTRAQECLLDYVEDKRTRSHRIRSFLSLTGDYNPTRSTKLSYVFPYYKRHESLQLIDDEYRNFFKAISQLPIKSTIMHYIKYMDKLNDRRYVFSLTGVDSNQILLNTLYLKCCILNHNEKHLPLKDIVEVYLSLYKMDQSNDILDYTYPEGNYMSYIRQTENLSIDYSKIDMYRPKTCKPVIYNTLENFPLRLSQDNMLYLSAIENCPDVKQILPSPFKFEAMKKYLMRTLPGTDDEKINYIKNFDPSEKEDRIRSGYLFIPSQVKVDTPARFFTYSVMYTTRRYMISSQKPQLFTPMEFSLESKGEDFLKHKCLLLKLYQKNYLDEKKRNLIIESANDCKHCNIDQIKNDIRVFDEMFKINEFRDFLPSLPFADYTTTQIRGKNVWYSTANFIIYTSFGSVESRLVEGNIITIWRVTDSDFLQELWQNYRTFCISRGIEYERPIIQDTGLSEPKVAFTDFDTPYIPGMFQIAMVLPHSKVYVQECSIPLLHRKGNKFLINDRVVDFMIYNVYDINEHLYNSHNLKSLKDIIYASDLTIDYQQLVANFDNSKAYKLLMNDPLHFSNTSNKYKNNQMLGAPGSFTRALALSDIKGETRYRSSYNSKYINKGAIEFDTVEGVPILDMLDKIDYSRMSAYEKLSFEKAINGEFLNYQDQNNLIRIKNKMGLEQLGGAIIAHKHIFRNMMAGNVMSIDKEILQEIITVALEAIHECMENFPKERIKEDYAGKSRSFWKTLVTYTIKTNVLYDIAILISRALIRSKSDNGQKFWSIICKNVLLSSMSINNKTFNNMVSMFDGLLRKIKMSGLLASMYVDGNPRFRLLALTKPLEIEIEEDNDLINDVFLGQGEPLIMDEDALDLITSGDDLEDDMELESREYDEDGDEYKALILGSTDCKTVMQETALNDYFKIELLSPVRYLCFPWLGKGNYDLVEKEGITVFRSRFPGNQNYPEHDFSVMEKVKTLEFREIIDKDLGKDKSEIYSDSIAVLNEQLNIANEKKIRLAGLYEVEMSKEKVTKKFNLLQKQFREAADETTQIQEQIRDLERKIQQYEMKKKQDNEKLMPHCLKDKDSAIEILSNLGIYNPKVVNRIFHTEGFSQDEILRIMQKWFDNAGLTKSMDDIIKNRTYGKSHLPGFQGVLEDKILAAELESIFGSNYFYILTGSVKLNRKTYNQIKKAIERNYNNTDVNDRSMLLFLSSILSDCVLTSESDQWFVDKINEIIDDIESKTEIYTEVIMMPVNPRPIKLTYQEKDIFG
jgi:hypothetical protein